MPSRLHQTLETARRANDRRDRDLATEMARTYAETWRRLQAELAAVLADPDSDPAREARLNQLIVQAEAEFHRWAQWASRRIQNEFPDVAAAAADHAAQIAAAMAPTGEAGEILAGAWNRINHSALAEMVAITSPASPVMELFEHLGSHAADTIASGLRAGVAQGWNPRKTARHIRDALGGDLHRALTIARTETMRAYREATRQTYLANSDIVEGWIWTAHPSTRTCAACWAMDGTYHPLNEELGSHPRCRCTMVPDLKKWGDIHPALAGLDELDHPTGAERFAELPEADQRAILGPSRFAAYKDGRLTIDDDPDTGVVQRRDDPVWGTTRTVRPIRDIPEARYPSNPDLRTAQARLDRARQDAIDAADLGKAEDAWLDAHPDEPFVPVGFYEQWASTPRDQDRALLEAQRLFGHALDAEIRRRMPTRVTSEYERAQREFIDAQQRWDDAKLARDPERLKATAPDWSRAQTNIASAKRAYADEYRRQVDQFLGEYRNVGIPRGTRPKVSTVNAPSDDVTDALKKAADAWADRLPADWKPNVKTIIGQEPSVRGHFDPLLGRIVTNPSVHIAPDNPASWKAVLAHEGGHAMEGALEGFQRIEWMFWYDRTNGGASIRELFRAGSGEFAAAGNFVTDYMGKIYRQDVGANFDYWELFSSWCEDVLGGGLTNVPSGNIRQSIITDDADMLAWGLSILFGM